MATVEMEYKMKKFDGNDYHNWKFKMRMFLINKDYWEIVNGTDTIEKHTTDAAKRDFGRRSQKALAAICLSLADNQLIHVRASTSAKDAWEKLQSHYERNSLSQKLFYRRRFFTETMRDEESMLDHINKMRTMSEKLEAIGAAVNEGDFIITLLGSLPESYANLITALENIDEDRLNWEDVKARLLHEEQKRKDVKRDTDDIKDALYTNEVKKKGYRLYCGKSGHWVKDCRKMKKAKANERGTKAKATPVASVATDDHETDDSDDDILEANTATAIGKHMSWCIDSGASKHMTFNKNCLLDYVELAKPVLIRLGDNRTIKAFGKGVVTVNIQTDVDIFDLQLCDVLYVPDIKRNLVSVAAITRKGHAVKFKEDRCLLISSGKTFRIGTRHNKLYQLDNMFVSEPSSDNDNLLAMTDETCTINLWHERFGHLGKDNLMRLRNDNLVNGLICSETKAFEKDCQACAQGKTKVF